MAKGGGETEGGRGSVVKLRACRLPTEELVDVESFEKGEDGGLGTYSAVFGVAESGGLRLNRAERPEEEGASG